MKLKALPPHVNKAIAVIIGLFVVLSLAYSFADRLKLGPDEPAHFIYIRSLAINHTPPDIAHMETYSEDSTSSHEGHQPPLYYAIMAAPYAVLNALGVARDTIWRVLRLMNILLGVVWIYLVYLLSRAFFVKSDDQPGCPTDKYALASAAFVAVIPTAPYMAAVVNNDILIALLFNWALIPMLAFFRTGGLSAKSAALLGLLMGLAILTKAQGLILVPLIVLAGICACRRTGYKNMGDVVRAIGIALGIAGLVSGWWFIRCQAIYGTPMPHSLYNPVLNGSIVTLFFFPLETIKLFWTMVGNLLGYFWLPYWLVEASLPWQRYSMILSILGLIWLIGIIIRLRRDRNMDLRALCFLLMCPIAICATWIHYVLMTDRGANLQGRLLLPSAAVIAIASILGADGWLKGVKAKKIGFAVGCAIMLMVNIFVLWSTVALRWGL
jgi:hypothetical protein